MASKNDDFDMYVSSSYDGATRKVVKSRCYTEEVEPGRFIRKCQKAEKTLKDCLGRQTEMVGYNQEYTEKDVTAQIVQGYFSLPNGFSLFSEAAEGMKKFFNVRSRVPTEKTMVLRMLAKMFISVNADQFKTFSLGIRFLPSLHEFY